VPATTIRDAGDQDAAAIAAIARPVIRDSAITFTSAEKTPRSVCAEIAARRAAGQAFLVAEAGGALLGYASYFQFRGGSGYARTMEHTIVLAPEARGRGVGRALMTELEARARAAGVHSLWAGVSAENPAGVAFHRAIGFAEVARLPQVGHKFGRFMDLILLRKLL